MSVGPRRVGEEARARPALRSYEFRREREASWNELEELLERAGERGLERLETRDLYRLPVLYRAAVSSLSVARSISLDRNLLAYLEGLVARAYVQVYGAKQGLGSTLLDFVARRFPRAVRSLAPLVWLSCALLALGTAAGYGLVRHDADSYYSLVPTELADGRSPTSSREDLLEVLRDTAELDDLSAFASFLFSHNARVGMLAFAIGPAAGVPVLLLLFSNGLTLGAFAGLHADKGLSVELWAWLLPHGVTELLAVALCGAAGLSLGWSVVFPGRSRRLENLARAGRRAAVVVLGAVAMFLVAALLEGFFRQLVHDTFVRYAVATASLLLWSVYFGSVGRGPAASPP